MRYDVDSYYKERKEADSVLIENGDYKCITPFYELKVVGNNEQLKTTEGEIMNFRREIGVNYFGPVSELSFLKTLSSFNDTFENESIIIGRVEDELSQISSILGGDIIKTTIGDVSDAYELLKEKMKNIDQTNLFEISSSVLQTVDEYFGGRTNYEKRLECYNVDNIKISDLKGLGVAMCVERASLAQNLLKFIGINSYYKSSQIIKDGKVDYHSYNLIEFDNKYYLFDTTIPNLIDNTISPLIVELDKDTFNLLSIPWKYAGISTNVSHYNPYTNKEVNITYDSNRERKIELKSLSSESIKKI